MHRLFRTVAWSALLVLAILLAGPQQLGGPVAVMSTSGDSMLPNIRPHHLVLVRVDTSYDVGEVIAVRSDELDSVVLHRVVGGDQQALVTKGDNNDWLDPERPAASEVIGQAWLTVPQAGRLLELPMPIRAAAALVALGGVAMSLRGRRARTRRTREARPESKQVRPRSGGVVWRGLPSHVLLSAGVALSAGAVLAGLSWTRPLVQAGPVDYDQHGSFSYDAIVPKGAVYPDGRIDSGEPVFLRIADRLEVAFDWRFEGPTTGELHGTGLLSAVIENGSGWSHTLPIGPTVEWTGDGARLVGELDLAATRRLTNRVADATGVAGSGHTVSLTADVTVEGEVAGVPFDARTKQAITFQTDEMRAVLTVPGSTDGTGLTFTETAQVTAPGVDPAMLVLGGRPVPVSTARPASLALLGIGGMLGLAALALAWRTRRWDDHRRISDRYGDAIVTVSALFPSGHGQVAVADIDQLVKLAQRRDLPVQRVSLRNGGHGYVVDDAEVRYRYLSRPARPRTVESTVTAAAVS